MNSNADPGISFRELGFVVVPRFLDIAECARLRGSCDAVLERARRSNLETAHSTPRISLLTDEGGAHEATLSPVIEFASGQRVCSILRAVTSETRALLELRELHYYHEQTKRDWDGDWHRDCQFGHSDPERERVRFETTLAVHIRVAFEADERLEIVPRSHARWDTPEQLRIRRGSDRATASMPGATRIQLSTGDGCLFHAWSIHRATYRCAPIRRTLDALYGGVERR